MKPEDTVAKAVLVKGGEEIAVDAKYASRYSILVRFPESVQVSNGAEFEDLAVTLDNESVQLGPCRLIRRSTDSGYAGNLVFTRDIYDYQELFYARRKTVLQSGFNNLTFILEHKNLVRQEFKDFVVDLTYSLSVYRELFDAMDEECADEPEFVREAIQQTVLANEGAEFLRFFDERLEELERLVSEYSREDHERHGFYFRRQVWSYINASALMRRTNLKPRGYSGDSEMMRMIYLKEDLGDSIFEKLMHRHPIESSAAQAVRDRCKTIVEMMREARLTADIEPGERLKVLSVACGPAFELIDLLQTAEDCTNYEFTLLDQDALALQEVAAQIATIEHGPGAPVQVEYLQESVRTMMSTRRLASRLGQFDFIYSVGLLDYLTAPVARALLANLYQHLRPDGQMIIGNCHVWNPKRVYMEYWGDWVLFYRTESDFLRLVEDLPEAETAVSADDMGIQMLLSIQRAD